MFGSFLVPSSRSCGWWKPGKDKNISRPNYETPIDNIKDNYEKLNFYLVKYSYKNIVRKTKPKKYIHLFNFPRLLIGIW